jgi:hypothetical protein
MTAERRVGTKRTVSAKSLKRVVGAQEVGQASLINDLALGAGV